MVYLICNFQKLNTVTICYIIMLSKFEIYKNCKSIVPFEQIIKIFKYKDLDN